MAVQFLAVGGAAVLCRLAYHSSLVVTSQEMKIEIFGVLLFLIGKWVQLS